MTGFTNSADGERKCFRQQVVPFWGSDWPETKEFWGSLYLDEDYPNMASNVMRRAPTTLDQLVEQVMVAIGVGLWKFEGDAVKGVCDVLTVDRLTKIWEQHLATLTYADVLEAVGGEHPNAPDTSRPDFADAPEWEALSCVLSLRLWLRFAGPEWCHILWDNYAIAIDTYL